MPAGRPRPNRPVVFTWDGNHMVPLPRFHNMCAAQFAIGEEYPLVIVENRSLRSHNHYFAALHEAFQNLAEEHEKHFPTEEHLRAWALVQCGYCTETSFAAKSNRDAVRIAAEIRRLSPFAVIKVREDAVVLFEPESQSMAAMKKERFEASKQDVLALVASMARTTPKELKKNAGRSG